MWGVARCHSWGRGCAVLRDCSEGATIEKVKVKCWNIAERECNSKKEKRRDRKAVKRDCGHNHSLHVSNKKRCGSCKNVKMHSSTLCAVVEIEDETSCYSSSKLGFRCVKANRSLSIYQSCSCEGDVILKLYISMIVARLTNFYQNSWASGEAHLLCWKSTMFSLVAAACMTWGRKLTAAHCSDSVLLQSPIMRQLISQLAGTLTKLKVKLCL